MNKKNLIAIALSALLVIVLPLFFFSNNNTDASETSNPPADSSEKVVPTSNGDSTVSNNVEDNINGDKADINNSIDNKLNNSSDNKIENNITNNISVNVDVNVSNHVKNDVDGSKPVTEDVNKEQGNKDGSESKDGESGSSDSSDKKSEGEDKTDKKDQSSDGDKSNNSDDSNNEEKSDKPNKEEKSDDNGDKSTNGSDTVWGVDSASKTTEEMLACVRDNFGNPKVWGRYLGDNEDVSTGITKEEVELLHSNDIQLLLIWNHFNDATGYENGKEEAKKAIEQAEKDGVPKGIAIFADIEPNYPVDSEFIRGWYDELSQSKYKPGIYGIFDNEKKLTKAFNGAVEKDKKILEETFIWTAAPNEGITKESNAPKYEPDAPENARIAGWQYGIDAKSCNIDTNLFNSGIKDILW